MTDTNVSFTLPLAEPGPILPTLASLAWKKVPTEEALNLNSLRGIGRSKRERIIDQVPTMGDFEKLRNMAVKANRHLSAMLPKGVGEDVADELVDRAIAWRAKWEIEQAKKEAGAAEEIAELASGEVDVHPATAEVTVSPSDTATETPTDAATADSDVLAGDEPNFSDLDSAPTTISQSAPVIPLPALPELASGDGDFAGDTAGTTADFHPVETPSWL